MSCTSIWQYISQAAATGYSPDELSQVFVSMVTSRWGRSQFALIYRYTRPASALCVCIMASVSEPVGRGGCEGGEEGGSDGGEVEGEMGEEEEEEEREHHELSQEEFAKRRKWER